MSREDILIQRIISLFNKWDCLRTRTRQGKYKAKGIGIHKIWLGRKGRERFVKWALHANWKPGLDIDRIDNSKGYFPSNCRFVTRAMNLRNTRVSRFVFYRRKKINLKTLSELPACKVNYGVLKSRLTMGWPLEKAMTHPLVRKRKSWRSYK